MRKLGLALALLLGLATLALAQQTVGPPNAILCNQGALANGLNTNGTSQVIALSAGKTIYICGWAATNTQSSGNFWLSAGTGTNCGTGNTSLTVALGVNSNAPVVDHIPYAIFSAPASQAICITPSTSTINAMIWYSQF